LAVALAAIGGVDVAVTIAILLALPLTLASVPRRRRRRALLDHRGCNDRLRGLRHLLLLLHVARRIVASRLCAFLLLDLSGRELLRRLRALLFLELARRHCIGGLGRLPLPRGV